MDIITLNLAKKYANKVAAGFSKVEVQGNNLIFTLNDGTKATMTVPTPEKGSDGISVVDLSIDTDGSLLCHMSDETVINAGIIPTFDKKYVDDNINKVDNKIVSTRNELERVKNDVLETGTDTDTYIHLEDSAMAEYQELEVDGVCKQETTIGKNLLNIEDKTITSYGMTITSSDGIIKVSGTPTNTYINLYITENFTLKAGTYYFSKNITGNYSEIWFGGVKVVSLSANVTSKSFTLNEDKTVRLSISLGNLIKGTATTINDIKVMLSTSSDTTWEKYTGGQPSPSPDYPQEIKTIENSLKITSCNKNLYSRKNGQYNVPIYATDGTSAIYQDINVVWVKVKPNTDYSFTLQPNQQAYFVRIIECTGDKGFIYRFPNNYHPGSDVAKTLTITTPNNCEWLQIGISQYQISQISQNNWEVMIEESTEATSFEQHLETQIEVNLPEGEFIGKINDTDKDTLKVEYNETDGQYHLKLYKRVYKNNSYNGESYNYYISTTARKDGNIECGELQTGQVVYYLGDETIIDLGIIDMPITYNEITNLFTNSDLMPTINAKYYRNFINTIQNLQVNEKALKQELVDINSRLSALESAQTNVMSESEVIE